MLVFITESRKSHATLKILTPSLITLRLRIYIIDEPVEGKDSISLIPPLALWTNGHQRKLPVGGGDKEALKSNELVVAG